MAAVIRRMLADRSRSIAIWGLSLALVGLFYMLLWPSIEDGLSEAVKSYPDSLKEAFGVSDLSTPEQFLNTELFSLMLPLVLAIFAARRVAASITGAEERGYLDVLLSAPLHRRALAFATIATAAIELALILALAIAGTFAGALIAGVSLDDGLMIAGYANLWPLSLLVAGTAMLVTGVTRHSAIVTGAAVGMFVAMYIADLLGRLADGADAIRYVSAFRYYGTAAVDGIDALAFAGMTLGALLLAAVGTALFERRDV